MTSLWPNTIINIVLDYTGKGLNAMLSLSFFFAYSGSIFGKLIVSFILRFFGLICIFIYLLVLGIILLALVLLVFIIARRDVQT